MSINSLTLKLISLNVRGIIDSRKRRKVFTWFSKQKADIVCMQETHCTKSKLNSFKNSWNGLSYYGLTDSAYSRGVGILFNSKLNIVVHSVQYGNDGRQMLINVDIEGKPFTIVNIYAPNEEKSRINFFQSLVDWIKAEAYDINNVVLVGDLNCCLREEDRSSRTNVKDKSRNALKLLLTKLNLNDMWHILNDNNRPHYTWSDKVTSSRLDYVFNSQNSSTIPKAIDIITVITDAIGKRITDHKALTFQFLINIPPRGPGYWKLNTKLLDDNDYCEQITKIITDTYNDPTMYKYSNSLKWDIMKTKIKEFSIKKGVEKARERRNELSQLENELKEIDKIQILDDETLLRKTQIQNRLDEIYTDIANGAQVRARLEQIQGSECNTAFYKGVENSRQTRNVIESLIDKDGTETSNQHEILKLMGDFYKNLYTSSSIGDKEIETFLDTITFEHILTDKQKEQIEGMPTQEELIDAIHNLKINKSPGTDGIPVLFYKKFWNDLKTPYLNMINECFATGILPSSTKTSVLSLLYKTDNRKLLPNYRPLSLTNYDYKILASVFAKRLQTVLPFIINQDQTACIKDRYIGYSVRNLIDLYDYTENYNIPGALICADFAKAYDTLEHNFMFSVLRRFNFGNMFIEWMKILYNEPVFKMKNNGWISSGYQMGRGIRQGCPLSSSLFIIAIEILALMIRKSETVQGIDMGNHTHNIIMYADDATICVRDLTSIKHAIDIVNTFSNYAGPKLSIKKTRGIWLGPLKDHGYRLFESIKWTGNPVKCLGIYIGHNKEQCFKLNWTKRITQMKNAVTHWSKRGLTLFGRVYVVKTHIMSKVVYAASLLEVPNEIIQQVKDIVYGFLWKGKRDKVKRSTVINELHDGGINMIDIESFLSSLKCAWVPRIVNASGKWASLFHVITNKMKLPKNYIWHMSFRSKESFPGITLFTPFYQDVILKYNHAKHIKPFNKMSKHEVIEQPLWGNEHFRIRNTCLYYKQWVDSNILYVKDLIKHDGSMKTENDFYNTIKVKTNIIQEIYVVKRYIIKRVLATQFDVAPYVQIRSKPVILHRNKLYTIDDRKSKFFYKILKEKCESRAHMESVHARMFNFNNSKNTWYSIYTQKIKTMKIPKVKEFNYKIISNIVACGNIISKWNCHVSKYCTLCNDIETTCHLLFECPHIRSIWAQLSSKLGFNITWKQIVCGWPDYNISNKIKCMNMIVSIIAYAIFKENSYCKYNKKQYTIENIKRSIKENMVYFRVILSLSDKDKECNRLFEIYCSKLYDK